LIYIAFLYLRHHKEDFGGYEKKKIFLEGRGAWRAWRKSSRTVGI